MSMRHMSSRSVRVGTRLLAASAVVAAPLFLTGCDESKDGASAIYPDVQSCIDAKVFAPEYCQTTFQQAKEQHTRLAPHYEDKQDCEKDWGDGTCEAAEETPANPPPHHGGTVIVAHSYYSPHMGGYWVGHVTDNGATGRTNFSYPVYRTAEGNLYSPVTEQSFSQTGRVYTRPNTAVVSEVISAPRPVMARGFTIASRPTSIGGFGATGHGFGAGA